MPLAQHRRLTSNADIRSARSGRIGRSLLIAGLIAGCLILTACGSAASSSRSVGPRILNTTKVARAIQQSSLAQRDEHAQVSCPIDVPQQRGHVFSCTALVGRVSTRFVVTELDGSGHVHYYAP